MDHKVQKNEHTNRKSAKLTVTKDIGDLKISINEKPIKSTNADGDKIHKMFLPDRGDSEKKLSTNQNKMKSNADKKQNIEPRLQNAERSVSVAVTATEKDVPINRNKVKSDYIQTRLHQDLEERRRIREKYTFRLKNLNTIATNLTAQDYHKFGLAKGVVKNADRTNNQTNDIIQSIETPPEAQPEHAKSDMESLRTQTKPIIKTVMLKNDVRLYKAVTFGYEKKTTPLQIKIPNGVQKKQKVSKSTDTSSLKCKIKATESRMSINENFASRRIDRKRGKEHKKKYIPSHNTSACTSLSPPTEVAKWAPSSINQHTKPYYEAWVNTRLAAISKTTDEEKNILEAQNLIDSIQRIVERPETPELIYENLFDERYTGRIKVTQRT